MATYAELLSLANDEQLRNKIRVAVWVACDTIRAEADTTPNHVNRVKWAATALRDTPRAAEQLVPIVLAQNRAATTSQITTATDAQVQAAVDAAINVVAQAV